MIERIKDNLASYLLDHWLSPIPKGSKLVPIMEETDCFMASGKTWRITEIVRDEEVGEWATVTIYGKRPTFGFTDEGGPDWCMPK